MVKRNHSDTFSGYVILILIFEPELDLELGFDNLILQQAICTLQLATCSLQFAVCNLRLGGWEVAV